MNEFFHAIATNAWDIVLILVISAIFYIFGASLVAWLTGILIHNTYHRKMHPKDLEKRKNTLKALVANIWRVTVVVVGSFAIIRLFFTTAELTPLFASASVIGVALGFGTQTIVKDFLSGLFIISDNQYRVGDVIEIDGSSGTVERIGARSTVLRDIDGNVHYFPNGMIQHVINKTMDFSMARITIGVAPEADVDKATKMINELGKEMFEDPKWKNHLLTAPSYVMLGDISADAINLIISAKVPPSDQWTVSAEIKRRILNAFEKNDIQFSTMSTPAVALKGAKK